jgi:NADH-quinone oxidoreductase subunit K
MIYSIYFDYLSLLLIFIGLWGLLINRSNLLILLLIVELLLVSLGIRSILFSFFFDDLLGQIIIFFIITIAATESALGLAIIVVYYRLRGSLNLNLINVLKT